MPTKVPRLNPSHVRAVGSVEQSMLTESQFQAINGTNWVLMDGRSIVGSTYASITGLSTLPDARGAATRAKNNARADGKQNPDVTIAALSYSGASSTVTGFNSTTINEVVVGQSVTGTNITAGTKVLSKGTTSIVLTANPTGAGTSLTFSGDLPLGAYQADQLASHTHSYINEQTGSRSGGSLTGGLDASTTTGATGGGETRGKNITLNLFIKIN